MTPVPVPVFDVAAADDDATIDRPWWIVRGFDVWRDRYWQDHGHLHVRVPRKPSKRTYRERERRTVRAL